MVVRDGTEQMMNHIDEEQIRTVQDIYEKMDLKFQS